MDEPIKSKVGVSLLQLLIMTLLALMSALRPVEVPPPVPTPVNGNWSLWNDNITCSVTCGGSFNLQFRACDNPAPAFERKTCPGSSSRVVPCNTSPCPINGNWGLWIENTTCSLTCGSGIRTYYRLCNYPAPAFGGNYCFGSPNLEVACNTNPCPVSGGWTLWSVDTPCTVSCGGGVMVKLRSCSNPVRDFCGILCTGNSSQSQVCNTNPCPINGGWTDWQDDQPCNKDCGGGTRTQKRTCTNPPPQYGGLACDGPAQQTLPCNTQKCPIDGNWIAWSDVTTCSALCGIGGKVQVRTCSSPTPANCGKLCPGSSSQIAACDTGIPCPACKTDAYTKDNGTNVCGFFLPGLRDWFQGKSGCEYFGALLPEIKSAREQALMVAKRPPGTGMWLNLDDNANEGTFIWESDKSIPTASFWNGGEPNNWGGNEDCAYITPAGGWNDFNCATTFVVYCELYFP